MLGLVPSRSGAFSARLSRVLALCQDLRPHDFVNGVLVFHADDVAEVLHAHEPLTSATLEFSGKFDTSMIKGAIQAWQERTYGIVVIDGSEASIGMARSASIDSFQNAAVTPLSHVTAKLASRTRRGGQSAPRFARARQGEELAFLRKVADMVVDELRDARGLILGGKADMKRKLLGELPEFLRTRVQRMVDIDTGSGLQGLLMTAREVPDAAARRRRLEAAEAVAHFMGLVSSQSDLVCYGVQETTAALRLAAVETLLVSSCKTWADLARSSGAHVLLVSPETELGRDFCAGFQVGALLRWKVEAQLMETELHTEEKLCAERIALEVQDGWDRCSNASEVSTMISSEADVFLRWLEEALKQSHDDASAESLAICASVILASEEGSLHERIAQTLEMLSAEGVQEDVLIEVELHATDLGF